MNPELKESRIIFQNALAHATKLVIHNSKGDTVHVEDVIALAKAIAREVVSLGMEKGAR